MAEMVEVPDHSLMVVVGAGLMDTSAMIQGAGQVVPGLMWGMAFAVGAAPRAPEHVIAAASVETAASLIAAIRENARRTNRFDALLAAIDRQEMMWREL